MHITLRNQLALPAFVLAAAIALTAFAGMRTAQPAYALTNCSVSDNTFDSEEAAFLTLINNYRAQNGLGALTISTNLNRAASWLAVDMGTNRYFSHTDSLGRSPSTRAQNCDYPGGAGENIAAGTVKDTAAEAFEMWRNSSGHNANMLNSSYKTIGIARANVAGSPYVWYWVTDFGLVLDGTGGGGATATPTRTATAVPPTATRTATAIPPTATRTATAIPPTATRTATALPPTATRTATRTATAAPPTATPTRTAIVVNPTATRTPTRTATAVPPTATRTATVAPPTATPTRTTAPSIVKAVVTSPAPGSTLPGSSATFNWTTGSGALEYFVYAGSSQGSNNYFGRSAGLATTIGVTNLPTNGSTVHVRLWTRFSTGWQVNDYTYTASSTASVTTAKAQMTSPAPGSRLGTSATFAWNTGTGATEYFLYVGTAPGNASYYAASTGTTRTVTVSGLPRDGRTIYVRLWTKLGSSWQYTDYTYLAAVR